MKKIISVALILVFLLSFFACGKKGESVATNATNVALGMGVYAAYGDVASAEGAANGHGDFTTTVAAVLLDKDGKILNCNIDSLDISVGFTSEGASILKDEYKSKKELGKDYGMSAYGTDQNDDGIVLEWYEQIAVFEDFTVGKTLDEIRATVINGYGNDSLQSAGCTVKVTDYLKALEKAVSSATEFSAFATDSIRVAMVNSVSSVDASEDTAGTAELEITVSATALSGEKITACDVDVISALFTFDNKGVSNTLTSKDIKTNRELLNDYGMSAYGTDRNGDGIVLEWYEQADAFCSACIGKTASEVAALVVDGYGNSDVQSAGCTISISDMVAAIEKAAKRT